MEDFKFKKGDYIVNRDSDEMGVIMSIDKKGYYHFSHYFRKGKMYDLKAHDYPLQYGYQDFFSLCDDEEKKKLSELIEKS